MDLVDDIATGKLGGDLLQKSMLARFNHGGNPLGIETNEAFTDAWLDKLKKDQGLAKADAAILVSPVLPKEIEGFGLVKGVWVCSPQFAGRFGKPHTQNPIDRNRQSQTLARRARKNDRLVSVFNWRPI